MRIANPKAVTKETICAVTTVTGVEVRTFSAFAILLIMADSFPVLA